MQVLCGQCGKTHDVDDELAGSTITCSECEHAIPVPRFDEGVRGEDGLEDTAFDLSDESDGFANEAKQAMSRKVHVVCGSCDRGLTVSARLAGKKARCPACGVKIRIPYPDEGDDERVLQKMASSHNEKRTRLDLSSAEEQFAGSGIPQRKIQVPEPKKSPPYWIMVAGGAVAALVVGILLGPRLFAPADNGSGDPGDGHTAVTDPIGPKPLPHPPVTRPTPTRPAPPVSQPEIAVQHVTYEDFAANGYFPARPGRVYWHVTALVRAGAKGASFRTHGTDVTLNVGGQAIESAGLQPQPGKKAWPISGRRISIRLAPDQSQKFTFVFDVPVTTRSATLNITSVTSADVQPTERPSPPAAGKLVGKYREVTPRNLRPMLRNRVMRAVQTAVRQVLVVGRKNDAGQYPISIPAAGVDGLAKPVGKGVYDLLLRHEVSGEELPCKLRAAADGERIVLFLADKPFHQITYSSRKVPGAPPRSRPMPVVGARVKPKRPPKTRPYETPDETKPAPRPDTSLLPRDHGRKTIFDF